MAIWLTVIAILVIAIGTVVLIRNRLRAPSAPSAGGPGGNAPLRKDTLPMELGATIRSYVIPDRWLRSPPTSRRARAEAMEHPRYGRAMLERSGDGAAARQWELLRGRTRLGRDPDNHVILDDERVSLHHALITVRDDIYWLEDLGSTNGTFVGEDRRVMAPHALGDGDVVRLGGVVLTFRGIA